MGTIADTALSVVDHLRAPGPARGLRDRHRVPPVPGRRARGALARRHARWASSSGPTSPPPPTTRWPARSRPHWPMPPPPGAPSAARGLRLRRPRLARRLGRRPRGRLRLAGRSRGDARRGRAAVLGVRHPDALDARAGRAPPGRRLQPARPLHRRLRLGHHQPAGRHASWPTCSTATSRPTRATARRRRACPPPTT